VSDRPPTREELAASLAVNAASKPFNIAIAVVAFGATVLLGAPAVVALLVALVLYTAAVGRTMFDRDEAERVARKHHGPSEPEPQPDPPATT
jgi:hypothetical protein